MVKVSELTDEQLDKQIKKYKDTYEKLLQVKAERSKNLQANSLKAPERNNQAEDGEDNKDNDEIGVTRLLKLTKEQMMNLKKDNDD